MRILLVGSVIAQEMNLSAWIPICREEPVPDPEWAVLMKSGKRSLDSEEPVRKLKRVGFRTNKWEF